MEVPDHALHDGGNVVFARTSPQTKNSELIFRLPRDESSSGATTQVYLMSAPLNGDNNLRPVLIHPKTGERYIAGHAMTPFEEFMHELGHLGLYVLQQFYGHEKADDPTDFRNKEEEYVILGRSSGLEPYKYPENGMRAAFRKPLRAGHNAFRHRIGRPYPLHDAATLGADGTLRMLLASGKSVDHRDKQDYTPLLCATERGRIACARLLCAHGADVNAAENTVGLTPFLKAIDDDELPNRMALIELFLKHGAHLNRPFGGIRPLYMAANAGERELVSLFCERSDLKVDALDEEKGETALHAAARKGHTRCIDIICTHAIGKGHKDSLLKRSTSGKMSPLQLAMLKGQRTSVACFVNHVTDLPIGHGRTTLCELFLKITEEFQASLAAPTSSPAKKAPAKKA